MSLKGRQGLNHKAINRPGRLFGGLFFVLILIFSCPLPAQDIHSEKRFQNDIIVGSELNYPPYATVDKNGEADGFSVDLIKAAAREVDIKLRFEVGPWSEVKAKLERGEIDALPLVAYSVEREKYFDFTSPHIVSYATAFVRRGETRFKSLEDLRNTEVIVMRDDSTHEYVKFSNFTDKVVLTNTVGESFKLLSSGKHDFVISPKLSGLMLLNELGIDNIVPFGDHLEAYGKGYAFAVHEGDADLLALLNRGLVLVKVSGEYDEIYDKWFGHVDPRDSGYEKLIRKVLIAGSILGVIIFIFILWNFLLRQQVTKKTSELKQSEAKLQTLINNVPGATFQCLDDSALTVQFISSEIENISGHPPSDFINNSVRSLASIIYSEDSHLFNDAVQTGVKNKQPFFSEFRIVNSSGDLVWVVGRGQGIVNEKGELQQLEGIIINDSHRKLMEQELLESQKMAALGTLVGGVAHEFNNTLAGMTGNLYLAKQAASELPQVIHRLETVEKLSFKAAGMIQQMLAFARKGVVDMKGMSLTACVKEAVDMHKVGIPSNICLKQNISTKTLPVKGDFTLLQQVVLNLLTNAIDAVAHAHEPTIAISLSSLLVDATISRKHAQLRDFKDVADICISDNGSGIEKEHLDKIFDPFFTTKEVGQGTGLGLSMVKGTVQTHHGAIQIDSKVGSGTDIHIYFPLLSTHETDEPTTVTQEIFKGHGETILLVDDDRAFLEAHVGVLRALGYIAITAENGQAAIDIYELTENIDLTILDIVMPVMGGIECAKLIREIDSNAKIVFATGYDKTDSLRHQGALDVEVVISKPFDVAAISQVIQQNLPQR